MIVIAATYEQFINAFNSNSINNQFSEEGIKALYDYLNNSEDIIELDPITISMLYTEVDLNYLYTDCLEFDINSKKFKKLKYSELKEIVENYLIEEYGADNFIYFNNSIIYSCD
jgi:hypothetical protein